MSVEPIILAHEAPFDLGPVHVLPEVRAIEFGGRTTILEPRVMQVLIALYRARGHVVSKDDLMHCCWESRVVGDDAINRVISRLRHNAQEDAGGTFKVETITKVGYRLSLTQGGSLKMTEGVSRRGVLTAGGVGGAVLVGGAYWLTGRTDRAEREEVEEIRRTLLRGTLDQYASGATQAEQFVDRHPQSADGWGVLAIANYFMVGPEGTEERKARVAEIGHRALVIDPKQADARTAIAALKGFSGRWSAAYRDIAPVLRDRPVSIFPHNFLANLFSNTGNYEQARANADEGLNVEAEAPPIWMLKALALDNLGRTGEAQETIEEAYDRWPKQYAVWFTRLYLLGYNGRTAEALAMIRSSSDWPVGVPADNQAMTKAQIVALGDRRPALVDDAIKRSLAMAPRGTGFAENAMQFLAALGLRDDFFALAHRYYFEPAYIRGPARFSEEQRVYSRSRNTWPLFRRPMIGMWRDPRFDVLIKRIGLDRFWSDTGFAPEYRTIREE